MAWPIVIATNGFGTPVTEVTNGLGTPYEIAANGFGTPVVFVASGGIPVMQLGYNPVTALGTDLLGYWEANRSDLITQSGGLVSSWKDVVAGYDVTQVGGSAKPGYSATAFNGAPALTYDGTDDELTLASVPFPTGAVACDIWALVQQDALVADTGARNIFAYGGGGGGVARRAHRSVLSGVNRANALIGNGTSVQVVNTSVDFSGRAAARFSVGAASTVVDVNTVAGTPTAVVPTTGTSRVRIGASDLSTASEYWQGSIAAILVTNPLPTDKAAALSAWLNSRR